MRLGTRWGVGSTPPAQVPTELRELIVDAERGLEKASPTASWTLTWLEGRPIATLDDGTTVTLDGVAGPTDPAESDSDDW